MLSVRWIPFACSFLLLAGCARQSTPGATPADAAHTEAMAREHAGDAPVANASAMEPAQQVSTQEVVYGTVNGQPLRGYLARPASAPAGTLPAVIVIHEWWGLNDNIRMMARRLAGEGYTALAVDMYGGEVATDPQQARALMTSVMNNREAGVENLEAAAGYLQREWSAERIGTIGWCFGGGWSLNAGLAMPGAVDAVVMYYGQPVTEPERLRQLDAPLLGLFGAEDQGIPPAQVREMEAALQRLGKDATIRFYEGAGHAFANPSGNAFQPEAAADAWQRTVAFLNEHLKQPGG